MKLSDLLELHDSFKEKQALQTNLGDGLLYSGNRVFRNVRDLFLAGGNSYCDEDFCDFGAMPRAALKSFIQEKRVYCRDNVSILRRLEDQGMDAKLLLGFLMSNQILHESAHLALYSLTGRSASIVPAVADFGIDQERERAVDLLIEEAFACTCEVMGNLYVDSAEHRLIYDFAIYSDFKLRPEVHEALIVTVEGIGFESAFRLIHLSYFMALFLREEVDSGTFNTLYAILLKEEPATNEFRGKSMILFNNAFKSLNQRFKVQTSTLYFQLTGFKNPFTTIVQFDFLKAFFAHHRQLGISQLAEAVETGKSPQAVKSRSAS